VNLTLIALQKFLTSKTKKDPICEKGSFYFCREYCLTGEFQVQYAGILAGAISSAGAACCKIDRALQTFWPAVGVTYIARYIYNIKTIHRMGD
jgi:hypothetical protein